MSREPSALALLARLAAQSARRRGGDLPLPTRRSVAERTFPVLPAQVRALLAATGGMPPSGTDAANGNLHAVSALPIVWEAVLCMQLLADAGSGLPRAGVFPIRRETVFLRSLRAGDRVRFRAEVERVERLPQGVQLTMSCRWWNRAGQLCGESASVIATGWPPGIAADAGTAGDDSPSTTDACTIASCRLRPVHGRRFARVAGSLHPVHLSAWSALLMGHRRPMLPGWCLDAWIARALIEQRLGSDATALRRLRTTFHAPVPLPAELRLAASGAGADTRFRVTGSSGATCFAQGSFLGC